MPWANETERMRNDAEPKWIERMESLEAWKIDYEFDLSGFKSKWSTIEWICAWFRSTEFSIEFGEDINLKSSLWKTKKLIK